MGLLYTLHVFFRYIIAGDWILEEEGVVHVSSWVGLGLEERIKVPEPTLHESVSGHLVESHLEQSLSKLSAHLQKWVQMSASCDLAGCVKIRLLELNVLPGSSAQHVCRQLGFELHTRWLKFFAFLDLIRFMRDYIKQFALL